MNKDDLISEEQLNAFIDDELDSDEKSRIFGLAEENPELDERLCRQHKLKEMVQHAYRNVPLAENRSEKRRSGWHVFGLSVAAMFLLAVGVSTGWFLSQRMAPGSIEGSAAAVAHHEPDAYLLHVSTSDPERMAMALRRADELMNGPGATDARRVEIVANESGIDLLRSDVSPFSEEIRELAQQDVLFFACTRAIERLERMGIDVKLLPEANSEFSALDRVVLRMQQGWEYIKI